MVAGNDAARVRVAAEEQATEAVGGSGVPLVRGALEVLHRPPHVLRHAAGRSEELPELLASSSCSCSCSSPVEAAALEVEQREVKLSEAFIGSLV